LRIINTGVLAEFQFEIDEHLLAVTEVDGTDVLPSYIHRLIINPAQRYSLIVSTNISTADSFWLRLRIATDCLSKDPGNPDLIAETNAVVRYTGQKKETANALPTSKPWGDSILQFCKDLNTTELVPVPAVRAPETADHLYYMYSNFKIGAWRLSRGFFNDSSWRPNMQSPVLTRFIDGWQAGNESFTTANNEMNSKAFNNATEMVIQVDGIKTIDIVIQNINEG
jgi:FtsP/CotA-like multicopper oxidase with cupredoxin domain